MMDLSLKRILAFSIDILLVTLVATLLTRILPIDPYVDKYQDVYEKYTEFSKENQKGTVDQDQLMNYTHDIYYYRVVSSAVSVGLLILYFGVLQMVWHGQTVGKKIFKIQLVSNNDKKLHFGNYLIRVIILNNILFTVLSDVLVFVLDVKPFYYVAYVLSLISSTIYVANILMIILKSDNRGLHDILAGTKVVDLKSLPVEN